MAKPSTQFSCQSCGAMHLRMLGRCPSCGAWNSIVEEALAPAPGRHGEKPRPRALPVPLDAPPSGKAALRLSTGAPEFDRVLGGGLVPGAMALLGGDPGIGKSTLTLQACASVARGGAKVLYVTGEESLEQVRLRAARLGCLSPNVHLLADTSLENALLAFAAGDWGLLVADSVQTLHSQELTGSAGSVGQVREVAAKLQDACKSRGVPCILVGHVTKDGSLAGPRVLEHLVDVVMQFEAAEQGGLRTLRALKNRFGSTQELGLFSMGEAGLQGVENPSQLFLGGGGLALASLQGSRPLLAEVQALVAQAHFGQPQRQSTGLDPYRLSLLYAVMEKRCGLALYSQDVFVSVAGGLRITEPAADLAVALAVAAGLRSQPAPQGLACFGEVGLGGELRPVSRPADRLREAARLGFKQAIFPEPAREAELAECRKAGQGLALKPVKDLSEALNAL